MSKRRSRRQNHSHLAKRMDPETKRELVSNCRDGADADRPQQPPEVTHVQIIAYGPDGLAESTITNLDSISEFRQKYPVVWVNVDRVDNVRVVERIGEMFGLHKLATEDVVHTHQRAKVDDYGDVLFIVLRMADLEHRANTEQLSMFLGKSFVITFQEEAGDCWESVRTRLRQKSGQLRTSGPDYLTYALLDAVIDAYFPVLEHYGERLEEIEDMILGRPDRHVMDGLHEIKTGMVIMRRAVWPLRDAMAVLTRDACPLIHPHTRIYLRDCYDHVVQVIDLLDIYRELSADLRDLYMSSVSNRINEVMRVLTIISTIFIPVTFIASIYGMNFEFMPELHTHWGYPLALAMMAGSALFMIAFFFRRGWFQRIDTAFQRTNDL